MRPIRRQRVLLSSLLSLSLLTGTARAVDGTRNIEQYLRRQWSAEQGVVGGRVSAVAQTPDGYLWVGTEQNLLRFDGIRFTLMQPPAGPPIGHVTRLIVDTDGALWITTEDARLLRYAHGKFISVLSPDQDETAVISVGKAQDHGVFAAGLSHGVVSLSPAGLTSLPISTTSLLLSLAQTTDGRLWLGTRETGLFAWKDGTLTPMTQGVPDAKINCLLPASGGQLWIGTDNGLARWDGHSTTTILPAELSHIQILTMVQDRDGNLWAGTARGLFRYNGSKIEWLQRNARNRETAVTALIEDREGDLWFGDGQTLERLRDSPLITYGDADEPPGDQFGPVYVDSKQRVWFAPLAGGLYWMQDGESHPVSAAGLDHDVVYSIDGRGDDIWVGRQKGGLTRLHTNGANVTAETWTTANGLAQNSVYVVRVVEDGSVWAGTLTNGLSHLQQGRFTSFTRKDALQSDTVSAIEPSPDGTLWFATPDGLRTLHDQRWQNFAANNQLPSPDVTALLADGPGMWIGTASGLAYAENGRVRSLSSAVPGEVLGLALDQHGLVWIATATRIISVLRKDLLNNTPHAQAIRSYGLLDGLQGTLGVRRSRSVVSDGRGRVWLTTNSGLSVTSPYSGGAETQAIANIESVSYDGSPDSNTSPAIIPPGSRRLTITYTGLDLSVPEQVRFRYRLDGFDKTWSKPQWNRQAVYTNLAPGNYRFRLIASSNDRDWGAAESTIQLHVKPLLWQRWDLRIALLVAALLMAVWIYRARLAYLIAQADMRSEERMEERIRIAREVHDTLLQGFISASMHLSVTADNISTESTLKRSLHQVLGVMERVIEEARVAVLGLRTYGGSGEKLDQMFRELVGEFGGAAKAQYKVEVKGDERTLRPVVYDEALYIGREAIVNATRHANADNIVISLQYLPNRFELQVRDDGCGGDPKVFQSKNSEALGLAGMRERSNHIKASLKITSQPGAGTHVLLTVPAFVAYGEDSE